MAPCVARREALQGGVVRAIDGNAVGTIRWMAILPDGRVLVVGGTGDDEYLASAEVWNPARATFSPTSSLGRARAAHTATLLPDGRLLVVGGEGEEVSLASAELWSPAQT